MQDLGLVQKVVFLDLRTVNTARLRFSPQGGCPNLITQDFQKSERNTESLEQIIRTFDGH